MFDTAKPIVTISLLAVTAVLLACEGPGSEGGAASFFGDEPVGTTTIAVTIKFSDFGKPVNIEAPEVRPTPLSPRVEAPPSVEAVVEALVREEATATGLQANPERAIIQTAMNAMMADNSPRYVPANGASTNSWSDNPKGAGIVALYPRYFRFATTTYFYCWDFSGNITTQSESFDSRVCPPVPAMPALPAPVAIAVAAPAPSPAPTRVANPKPFPPPTPTADPLRDFEITLYQGEDELGGAVLRHSDLLKIGKPIVLNFWAAALPPSRAQLPDLQRLHQEYGDRITLLAVDFGGLLELGTEAAAVELLQELGSDTSRSWKVPLARSTRPFASGLWANTWVTPSSLRARPHWVGVTPRAPDPFSSLWPGDWKTEWRSVYTPRGIPCRAMMPSSSSKYPWVSSRSRKTPYGTVPVASSTAKSSVSQGPRSSNQVW